MSKSAFRILAICTVVAVLGPVRPSGGLLVAPLLAEGPLASVKSLLLEYQMLRIRAQ